MNRMNRANLILAENLVTDIMKEFEACGIAAAIIDGSGNTVYEKYWGVRDKESGKEVNGETIFGLASVTKSFTCLAIMQMAERGLIDINAPISKYIPEFTNKNQKGDVTVRHLMCHAGGFFPLPRIVVEQVAESLGLDEAVVGDLAYNDELAAEVLDELSAWEMAQLFNEEKILDKSIGNGWNENMVDSLNENGRKHIKKLHDMVCKWYEANPEDAEAEGYMEW